MYRKAFLIAAMILSAAGVACQPDSPADHLENAGDELSAAAEDAGNELEDACEEVKQEAGASDTDC